MQFIYEEKPPQFYYNSDNTKLIEAKTKREAGIVGYFDDCNKNKQNALGSVFYFVPDKTIEMGNIYVVAYDNYLYLVRTEDVCRTYSFKILMAYFAQEELTMCMFATNDLKVLFCVFPDDDTLVEYNYANRDELKEKVRTYVHIDLNKNILYEVYPNKEQYKVESTEEYAEDYIKTKLLRVNETVESSVIDNIINSAQQVFNSSMIKVPDFTQVTVDSSDEADEDVEDDYNSMWSENDEEENYDDYDEDEDEEEEDNDEDNYVDYEEEDADSSDIKFLLEGRNIDSLINMYSEAFPILKDLGTLYKNPKFSVAQRSIVLIFAVQLICSNKLFKLSSAENKKYFEKYTNKIRVILEGILNLGKDTKAELDNYYALSVNLSNANEQNAKQDEHLTLFMNIIDTKTVNFSCTLIYYMKILFGVNLPFNSSLLYGMIKGDNDVMGMSYVIYSLIVSKLAELGNNKHEEWNIDKILKYLDVRHLEEAHAQEGYAYPYGYNNSAGIIDTMLIANAALRSIDEVDEHRYVSDIYNMVGGFNEVAETCNPYNFCRSYRNNGVDISKVLKKEKEGSYKKNLNIVAHYLRGLINSDNNLYYFNENSSFQKRHRWLLFLKDFTTPETAKKEWFAYQSEWSKVVHDYPYVFTKTTFDNSLFRQMVWVYQNYNLHPFLSVVNYTDNKVEIPSGYVGKVNNVKEDGLSDGEEAFVNDLQIVADFIFTFIVGWKYYPNLKDLYEGRESTSIYMFGCTPWESMLVYINQACIKKGAFDYVMLDNITTQFVLVYTNLLQFYKELWSKTVDVGSTLNEVISLFDSMLRYINVIRIRNQTLNLDSEYLYSYSNSISGDSSVKLLASCEYIKYSIILLDLLKRLSGMSSIVEMKNFLDNTVHENFLELTEMIAFTNNKFSNNYSFDIDDEISLYEELYKRYNYNYSDYINALNKMLVPSGMDKIVTLQNDKIHGSLTLIVLLTMLKFDTYTDFLPYTYTNHLLATYNDYKEAVEGKHGYFLGRVSMRYGYIQRSALEAIVDRFDKVLLRSSFSSNTRLDFRNFVFNVFYLRLNAIIYYGLNNLQNKAQLSDIADRVQNYIDWVGYILSDVISKFTEMPILKYQNKLSLFGNIKIGDSSREYIANIYDVGTLFIMCGLWLSKDDGKVYDKYSSLMKLYFDVYKAFDTIAEAWTNEFDGYVLFWVNRNELDSAVTNTMKIGIKSTNNFTKNSFYTHELGYSSDVKLRPIVIKDLKDGNIISEEDFDKYVESKEYILIELNQLVSLFIASAINLISLIDPNVLYTKKVQDIFGIIGKDYDLYDYFDYVNMDVIIKGLAYDTTNCLSKMTLCESVLNFILQTLNNNHIETNNNRFMKDLIQQYFEN